MAIITFRVARVAFGVLLFFVLFLPFGFYNTMAEPYVSGAFWGFMLPVGYVAAASGIALLFYSRIKFLKKFGMGYLLILIGVLLLISLLYPRELTVIMLYGTNAIDTDRSTFTGAVFWLALLSITAGIVSKALNTRRSHG